MVSPLFFIHLGLTQSVHNALADTLGETHTEAVGETGGILDLLPKGSARVIAHTDPSFHKKGCLFRVCLRFGIHRRHGSAVLLVLGAEVEHDDHEDDILDGLGRKVAPQRHDDEHDHDHEGDDGLDLDEVCQVLQNIHM